jgi:hypothetical protein
MGLEPLLPSSTWSIVRIGAGLAMGLFAAVATWSMLRLLGRDGALRATAEGAPVLRRADAHPDAPARRPLSAAELAVLPGLPEPEADPLARELPRDLDTPLAALDPRAIPPRPRPAVRAVATLAPGERLETFRLTPPPRPCRPRPGTPGSTGCSVGWRRAPAAAPPDRKGRVTADSAPATPAVHAEGG